MNMASAFGGGRSRRQAGAGCKLYVGNISFQMTQADLQSLFSPFGRVQDTYLPVERDSGRPRGFGFVTFSSSNEAQAAIQESAVSAAGVEQKDEQKV